MVDRARYLWVYIRKSTRSTGTYGQPGHERVAVREPVADRDRDVVAGLDARAWVCPEILEGSQPSEGQALNCSVRGSRGAARHGRLALEGPRVISLGSVPICTLRLLLHDAAPSGSPNALAHVDARGIDGIADPRASPASGG